MSNYKVLRAKTGEDKGGKAYYANIGRLIETSKGPSIKLDMIPLGWDGWAMVMDPLPPKGKAGDDFDDIPL